MGVIEVVRGEMVESRHRVHVAVVDADGLLVASVGDPATAAGYRSAAKPLQALPLVEDGVVERFGFTLEELALCCASHEGEEAHVAGVRSILDKAGLDESALRCGPHTPFSDAATRGLFARGEEPARIHNNCSGKHAGMLALAVAHGWDPEGYHLADHPVQRRMLDEIVRWTRIGPAQVGTAVDGCGVVCFGVPLDAMAGSFARFAAAAHRGEAPGRIVEAMVSHPFMVGGTRRACTEVMERTGPRAFVKLGAEGVYGGGLPARGLGFAIKVTDGARRGVEVALVRVLEGLGSLDESDVRALERWRRPPVGNTLGDVVGEVRPAFELVWT
ncbi:MAG TPA: asparaginase [Longimicrobiales bacterium]|nr:asparaginase [Longimicrobiales bacterium]